MIFLFDANFPVQLGRALKELSRAPHEFKHVDEYLGQGASDEVVIQAAAAKGWFLVSLDKGIVRNPAKRRLLFDGGVGAFSFTGSAIGNWSYYQIVSFVMAIAEQMFEVADIRPALSSVESATKRDSSRLTGARPAGYT